MVKNKSTSVKKTPENFEQFFKTYLKENAPFECVMGSSNYINNEGKLVTCKRIYVIIDENLQVIWSHDAWKGGNFHPSIVKKRKECMINSGDHKITSINPSKHGCKII